MISFLSIFLGFGINPNPLDKIDLSALVKTYEDKFTILLSGLLIFFSLSLYSFLVLILCFCFFCRFHSFMGGLFLVP